MNYRQLHTVNLHTVRLDVSTDEFAACSGLLSADEIARADRFVSYTVARRWRLGRARLRQILASYCNIDPAGLQFVMQEHGKPILAAAAGDPELHFNMSHSHSLAVVAVTRFGPVGVDVECLRRIRDYPGVVSRFFSHHEQAQMASVAAEKQSRAFYHCWTRKEAVIKATGEGLSARLDGFDVSLLPGEPAAVLEDRLGGKSADPWQLQHFEPDSGYVGAAAIRCLRPIEWRNHSYWPAAEA